MSPVLYRQHSGDGQNQLLSDTRYFCYYDYYFWPHLPFDRTQRKHLNLWSSDLSVSNSATLCFQRLLHFMVNSWTFQHLTAVWTKCHGCTFDRWNLNRQMAFLKCKSKDLLSCSPGRVTWCDVWTEPWTECCAGAAFFPHCGGCSGLCCLILRCPPCMCSCSCLRACACMIHSIHPCVCCYLLLRNCPGIRSPCILWQSWRVYLRQNTRFQFVVASCFQFSVFSNDYNASVCGTTGAQNKDKVPHAHISHWSMIYSLEVRGSKQGGLETDLKQI